MSEKTTERTAMPSPMEGLGESAAIEMRLTRLPDQIDGPAPSPALIRSMELFGQLNPIWLRVSEDGKTFVLLAGRRRVKAARELGWETIDALVFRGAGEASGAALTLAEQGLRSPNPVSEFRAVMTLKRAGFTEREIGAVTGFASSTIKKLLRLEKLSPEWLERYARGQISPSVASELAKQGEEFQAQAEEIWAEKGRLTFTELEELRRVRRARKLEELTEEDEEMFGTDEALLPARAVTEDRVLDFLASQLEAQASARAKKVVEGIMEAIRAGGLR